MRAWLLFVAALAGCGVSTAILVACAGDGNGSAPVASVDAGQDVALSPDAPDDAFLDEEADVYVEPCTPAALCPNGPFDPKTPGGPVDPRARIVALRGRSASDIWGIGGHGTIVHFDGTSWKRSDPGTIESMNAIWLRSSAEVAFATLNSIYTRDLGPQDAGTEAGMPPPSDGGWTANGIPGAQSNVSPPSNDTLTSSWAAAGAEWLWCTSIERSSSFFSDPTLSGLWRIHVVPSSNTLELGNGIPPGICATNACLQLVSIHGASADDLWAVGYTGAVVHITNAQSDTPTIRGANSQTWAGLNGVWAASTTDVWAVGGVGTVRHYGGQSNVWDIVSDVPATEDLHGVWGTSASDIWVVGDGATVLHYDGKGWSRIKVGGVGTRRPSLYAVWSPAPGHVWVGGDGVILSLGGNP